jgi:hypothetical protein
MPAGNTYESIATTTLGSNQTSVTFSSIPSTYTDLIIVASTSLVAVGATNYLVTYNSDTGSNYSGTYLYGSGSATGSGRVTSTNNMDISYQPTTSIGNFIFQVFNYANTTTNKTSLSRSNNATSGGAYAYVGLWRSTAAITTISIAGGTNNIASGSTFSLYGIASA